MPADDKDTARGETPGEQDEPSGCACIFNDATWVEKDQGRVFCRECGKFIGRRRPQDKTKPRTR